MKGIVKSGFLFAIALFYCINLFAFNSDIQLTNSDKNEKAYSSDCSDKTLLSQVITDFSNKTITDVKKNFKEKKSFGNSFLTLVFHDELSSNFPNRFFAEIQQFSASFVLNHLISFHSFW